MYKFKSLISIYLVFTVALVGFAVEISAQNNRNQRDVRVILRDINSELDDFRYALDADLSRSSMGSSERRQINSAAKDLEDALSEFNGKFQRGRESARDVSKILDKAKNVNDFVNFRGFSQNTQSDWLSVRNLLDRLAQNYSIYPNWSNGSVNYNQNIDFSYNSLTGTYQLNTSKTDDPDEIIDDANIQTNEQRRDLQEKLYPADQLAIDVRRGQIVIATSNNTPVTLIADGRDRDFSMNNGQRVKLRAMLRGEELVVATRDDNTDFTITYSPQNNGNSLKVTRRVTTSYLRQTIFSESFYNKTDQIARLGIENNNDDSGGYSSNDDDDDYNNNYPTTSGNNNRRGDFIVPNGTIITGILQNEISTKISQNNDRFRLVVDSPNQFRGAVIEGFINGIQRSGRLSGRSKIAFNFERIRLTNGETYDFVGTLESVTDANGKTVKVDTEGVAKGGSQTKTTATRGAIGAGIGAIIGAIAGGAKGAAIGAIIGGSAGTGSVVLTGKDDLELKQGSTVTVQSTSPR